MRTGMVAALIALSVPALAATALNLEDVAGVYKQKHVIEVYGEDKDHLQVEDVLEVVKTSPDEAYVRARLIFTNGHECTHAGIFKWESDSLVWRSRAYDGRTCELRLRFGAEKVRFGDKDSICRLDGCGARGAFDGFTFNQKSRRPIRYMSRLLASRQYKEAIADRGK